MPARNISVIALAVLFFCFGCSGNKEAAKTNTPAAVDTTVSSETVQLARIPEGGLLKDTLEFYINEAMSKLRNGDKTALYENELRYYTDEHDFDEYLKAGEVRNAQADSLTHVEVTTVTKFPSDSLYAGVIVHFKGKKGNVSSITDTVPMYFSGGRWKRPLASKYINEIAYEKLIKQAEQDAGK